MGVWFLSEGIGRSEGEGKGKETKRQRPERKEL